MPRKSKSIQCICQCCGDEALARIVDNGIGGYEYWGARGTDVQLAIETDCCGAPGLKEDGELITFKDIEGQEPTEDY